MFVEINLFQKVQCALHEICITWHHLRTRPSIGASATAAFRMTFQQVVLRWPECAVYLCGRRRWKFTSGNICKKYTKNENNCQYRILILGLWILIKSKILQYFSSIVEDRSAFTFHLRCIQMFDCQTVVNHTQQLIDNSQRFVDIVFERYIYERFW